MKKLKKVAIILAILVTLFAVGFNIVYTNAKYVSSVSGKVTTSVARWVFDVTGCDSASNGFSNLEIAKTCTPETLVNGKVAPGTSGSFEIIIDATGSDVGINYDVTFTPINQETITFPTNLKFKLDGENWTFSQGISGTIDANYTSAQNSSNNDGNTNEMQKQITHTVTWEWLFTTPKADETDTNNHDLEDTLDGLSPLDCSFAINVTGTQVAPIIISNED